MSAKADPPTGKGVPVVRDKHHLPHFEKREHYTLWERGAESMADGSGSFTAWQEIRETHLLSREDLEHLSADYPGGPGDPVCWEEITMVEDRGGMPTWGHLQVLALLEGVGPGALLDRVLEARGAELAAEDDDA